MEIMETEAQRQVRVGKLPGRIREVDISERNTILDVLAAAQLTQDGYELRLNGTPAEMEQRVKPGDTVLLVKKIKGN